MMESFDKDTALNNQQEWTRDHILRGRLTLYQPKIGYRFSIDPLLLADFMGPPPYGTVLDVGAGVGILGLLLSKADPLSSVTLVELQPRLAELCRKNTNENQMAQRIKVVEGDILDAKTQKSLAWNSLDTIVTCPPYYKLGAGGMNPNTEEALARHEVTLPLPKLISVASRLVKFRGHFSMVYPSSRLTEVFTHLVSAKLQPTRLRLVYPKPGLPAQRVLLLAVKGGRGGLVIDPPFFIRDEGGVYTKDAQRALGEDADCPTQ